jgi:hypothetical protein
MLRLPSFAIVCSGLAMAAACGPLSAPLPRRLTPDRQRDVDEAWDRALSPVTKYDRVTWLDVLIVRQPYEVGVDKFEFKSEKRFSGGVVEMESRFDRNKPDEDLFVVTVKDGKGAVMRRERYTRQEIEQAREDLARDNATSQKARWKRIDEVFPKELLGETENDAGTRADGG